MIANLVVFMVIATLIAGAVLKIYVEKRRGAKCIGCPYSRECTGKRSCQSDQEEILTDTISKTPR